MGQRAYVDRPLSLVGGHRGVLEASVSISWRMSWIHFNQRQETPRLKTGNMDL